MTNDNRIPRLLRAVREAGIDELRQLSRDNPPEFMEMMLALLDMGEEAAEERPIGPIQFVITQQPGSNNRT